MKGEIRRVKPNSDVRAHRTLNLLGEISTEYEVDPSVAPGLEPGNKKTGQSGGKYKSIRVWNLPPAVTCPGASAWCLNVCYNGDDRPDVFQKSKWRANLAAFKNSPEELAATVRQDIDSSEHPLAIRIHSSGDFFSNDYIQFWTQITDEYPDVTFWAYTRSWSQPELVESLSELRARPNMQLFASWDTTMPTPPDGWRISYVQDEGLQADLPGKFTRCPEEYKEGMDCASCGFCLRAINRGVLFNAH